MSDFGISLSGMDAKSGRRLSGIEHICQSIADILTTPIGSRLMRRGYGSLIPSLVDQPLNGTTILRIYAATAAAINQWEPRIRLTNVQLERDVYGQIGLLLDGTVNTRAVQIPVGVRS